MTSIILGIAVAVFAVALVIAFPAIWSSMKSVKGGLRLGAIAWAAIFIGQGQMFPESAVAEGIGGVKVGAIYQLVWMVIGFGLIAIAFAKTRTNVPLGKTAIWGLAIYAFVGIAGAMFSPSPALSVYKAGQVLMDVVLVVIFISILVKSNRYRVALDLSYFLLALVLASAALGGILWPEKAYENIEGAFTGILRSQYPRVHFNELGLLSAIVLIAGLRRAFERGTGAMRAYWIGASVLAATVLFYAQARTSLTSFALALLVMSVLIPRMRVLGIAGIIAITGIVAAQWMSGNIGINVEGTAVETYLRRGASDEQLESMSGRLGLWQAGWQMFKDKPVFGHGMDAGVRFGGVEYGLPEGTNMHSAHMQILVNNGVVGYAAWLIFVIAVVYAIARAYTAIRRGVKEEQGRFNLELALVAFVILFRSLLGHVLVTHHFSFMVFLAVFIAAVGQRLKAREASVDKEDPDGGDPPEKQGNILARRRRQAV